MKTKTKALILAVCAVLLVVTTVFATVAFLTSTATVTNTFTFGKVAITLDETDVDLYGVKDGDSRVAKNDYKLIPGHTYIKDPTVHVAADSEESYIRMIVTISDFADVKAAFGDDFLPQNFVKGWDSAKWLFKTWSEKDNVATYEFRYHKTVKTVGYSAPLDLEPLFTDFFVPGTVDNAKLAKLEELEINVVAHAIQADGFASADDAWNAFSTQVNK